MNKSLQDIDYLYSSSRLRCLEKNLLNRERMERMCEAKTNDDAAKILEECNYPDFAPQNLGDVEKVLFEERTKIFKLLDSIAPDKRLVDIFRIKYDYHNIKTILKGDLSEAEYEFLLAPYGRFEVAQIKEMMRENSYAGIPAILRDSILEARDVLGRTVDPQLADFVLDRGCYLEMLELAKALDSKFIIGYVKMMIDAVNLRAAVRTKRMGRGIDFLKQCLIPNGNVSLIRFNADITPDFLEGLYGNSALANAAEAGGAALRGEGTLARVDLECDNAVTAYLRDARYVSFGEQPIAAYAAAKEAEITAVRTIMAGRFAGLPSDTIKERLREAYV